MTVCTATKTDDVAKVQRTLAIAFADSVACRYLNKKFQNIPTSTQLSEEENNESYKFLCEENLANGGFLLQSNDFDCVAIAVPPQDGSAKGMRTNDPRFNDQFIDSVKKLKHSLGLGTKLNYYYLFMIGKNLEQPEVRGSARAVLNYLKQKADEDDVAVVLEAINDSAKKVYEYFGFVDYGEINYGQGDVNSQGQPDPNGEGFVMNLMAYYKGGKLPLK